MRIIERSTTTAKYAESASYPLPEASLAAWQFIQSYLKASNGSECSQTDLDAAISVLPSQLVLTSYIDLIRTTFKLKIVPALSQVDPSAENFAGIVLNLSDGLARYETCFSRLKIGNITTPFQALVVRYLDSEIWRSPIRQWIVSAIEHYEESFEFNSSFSEMYNTVCHVGLRTLFEEELMSVLSQNLLAKLETDFSGNWEESQYEILLGETLVKPMTLLSMLGISIKREDFEFLAQSGLAKLRTSELFDIIVDFPASTAAVEDLRLCLNSRETRASLVTSFEKQCQARLLHPGANTTDIITIYIAAIKVFLLLDPPGVLLDKVARPIRKYLRDRPDTIRCIISSLLGEVNNDLAIELSERAPPAPLDDEDDPDWEPDPIDAAPDYAKNRASDIIGSLISIYENKDIFVRELQTLLSDRLLAVTDYNIDQELRNLEFLKVRFGDSMLSVCDVMLKDMSDSRRIDNLVHADGHENVVHATIVSRLYWPTIKSTTHNPHPLEGDTTMEEKGVKLPKALETMFADYSSKYSELKAQRSLILQKDLGHVRVQLDFEDRSLDMLVIPAHAASIHLFDDVSSLNLETIAERLHLTTAETKRNLAFWVKQQVLSETGSTYSVIESIATGEGMPVQLPAVTEPILDPSETAPPAAEDSEQDDTYWAFIVGMLTNVGSLELERIHSMLGMFAPNYDSSLDGLRVLMTRKVRMGDCELKGGMYKLP